MLVILIKMKTITDKNGYKGLLPCWLFFCSGWNVCGGDSKLLKSRKKSSQCHVLHCRIDLSTGLFEAEENECLALIHMVV